MLKTYIFIKKYIKSIYCIFLCLLVIINTDGSVSLNKPVLGKSNYLFQVVN